MEINYILTSTNTIQNRTLYPVSDNIDNSDSHMLRMIVIMIMFKILVIIIKNANVTTNNNDNTNIKGKTIASTKLHENSKDKEHFSLWCAISFRDL